MRKTLATLAILAASVCSAYTNTVLVSTNTRAATEKWVSVRFEATLPSTPINPASKFLNGNREWTSISLGHPQLSDINGDVDYQHITTGQVSKLDYISDNGVLRVHDSAQPSRYLFGVVNGTGTMFEVTGPFTNLMVTLSDDFEETVTHTRPAWTNNVFPYEDENWLMTGDASFLYVNYQPGGASWSAGPPLPDYPIDLVPTLGYPAAQGTATVSIASIYYTTNAIKHLATEAELEAAKAACGVVLTNTVNAATNALMPYARTLYGDVSTTNETGYAAFNATNAAVASYSALITSSAVGSFTNIFRYNFNGVRKFGTLTNTARFLKSGFGAGYKAVSTVVSVKDAAGNVLASSASQPVNIDETVTTQAAITNTLAIPLNIYSGTVEIACIAVSTNASFAVRLYSGAQYTNILTFSEAPTAYATYAELRALRAEIPDIVPDGIVTNGMGGATIGGIVVSNGYILSGISAPVTTMGFGGFQDNRFILRTPSGVNGGALIAGDNPFVQFCAFNFDALADFGFAGSDIWFVNRKTGKLRFGHVGKEDELMVTESGDVSVKNSLTVGKTNTAAEVRTLGGYSIFDAGSNCYWRVTASNGTFYASDTNGVRKFKFTTETP